jgi:glutathione S-transferase
MMVMHANVPLRSVNYDLAPKPEGGFDASCWFDVKPQLKEKNPLINLPYIIDGDRVITQSNACFLYLGRKLGMLGKSDESQSKCEELLMEIMDIRGSMSGFAYGKDASKETATELFHKVTGNSGSFAKLELWLQHEVANGHSGTYLVDDYATAPDFHLHEVLDQYSRFTQFYELGNFFEHFPHLEKFYQSFRALPANQKYLSSILAKLPFNNKIASFGATQNCSKWVHGMEYDFHDTTGVY